MKIQLVRLLAAVLLFAATPVMLAQGTAFTYQGQLLTTNGPAHGLYDFTFALYNASTGGSQAGSTIQTNGVNVTNGLFMATMDFGPGIFNGTAYWLQIGVRTNSAASFTALTSRQELTPAPYAIYAENATMLAYGTAIGTGFGNSIQSGGTYDFIGGGQFNTNGAPNSTIGGGAANYIESGANTSTIGGGANNTIQPSATDSTVGGGTVNTIQTGAYQSTIAGGNLNVIQSSADQATIAGGDQNVIQAGAVDSTIGGGTYNTNSNSYATVGGGSHNTASGQNATVSGGGDNVASGAYATVAGGGGQPNIASGQNAAVGGGTGNIASGNYAAVSGGQENTNSSPLSMIGSGYENVIQPGNAAVIGGGYQNLIETNSYEGTIAGGWANSIDLNGEQATIGGGHANVIQAGGFDCTIGGGAGNTIYTNNSASTISGGSANTIAGNVANGFIGGGYQNTNDGTMSVIGGGQLNIEHTSYETIAGGYQNTAFAQYDVVGGGYENIADGPDATVPGGESNLALGQASFAAGQGAYAIYANSFVWSDGSQGIGGFESTGPDTFSVLASGGITLDGAVVISSSCSVASLTIRGGADLAEPFPMSAAQPEMLSGSVVVIDDQHPGQLKLSDQPYDTRVAGVISGANGIHPGIQMLQQDVLGVGRNVALTGRVYVRVDASYGAILPGDFLTTSPTPGCAMKVTDHFRAEGAILGKAMTGLGEGRGMVLVLVTLQ